MTAAGEGGGAAPAAELSASAGADAGLYWLDHEVGRLCALAILSSARGMLGRSALWFGVWLVRGWSLVCVCVCVCVCVMCVCV